MLRRLGVLTTAIMATLCALGQERPVPADTDYLRVVRAYADALLAKGRDTYGPTHSPLFAVSLDRETGLPGLNAPIEGIRPNDRMATGANPMHDENLYQILYALSTLAGDDAYAREADRTLTWFFEHCQSPATGLLAWGEHIGWDFYTERPIDKPQGDTHEFFRPWVLWKRSYALAPDACARFAHGLWDHQIDDRTTGEFSRHAHWSSHGTGGDNEYPRHGGFFIAAWAEAYEHTHDAVFLTAIETLVDYYNASSSRTTGAIPCSSNPDRAAIMWPESNLSLAVDLWDHAPLVPEAIGAKMRERANKTDAVFLKLSHDFSPNGIGFVSGAHIDTLGPLEEGHWTHTQLWATSYGKVTDAQEAMLCHLRYRQVRLAGYRALILGAAQRYLDTEPDASVPLFPGAFGDVIFLMLAANDLTGEVRYLDRADFFARRALDLFLDKGPLPRASTMNDHYEAITRADTLMMALLDLWAVRHGRADACPFICCDR